MEHLNLPSEFITRTRNLLGEEEYTRLESALSAPQPVSVRINPFKPVDIEGTSVPWCPDGRYLPERPSFTFDPLFHAGCYYVQEASSMFLEQAIKAFVDSPVTCLDLCAAPGGKSTHLLSLLPEGSVLVSNEVIKTRSNILAENIAKWGNPESIVINNDPAEIGEFTHLFDVIVTDVPCSGEGMFRKDTDSTGEWSVANVNLCASRQRRIIHDIWNALKPGGLLIYSTCTYNTEENEDNIHYIIEELGAEALEIPVPAEWNITCALKHGNPVYHFFPHKTKGEGFFLAALRKADGEIEEIRMGKKGKDKKQKGGKQVAAFPKGLDKFLIAPDNYKPQWADASQSIIRMQSENVSRLSDLFLNKLRVLSAGIELGEVKGKDLIPSQSLALSYALNRDAFPCVEISWETAIQYLRKEAITLPEGTEKGFVLLTYGNIPLGFVKNLGSRSNNLYPQEWRIRSGYSPEKEVCVGKVIDY